MHIADVLFLNVSYLYFLFLNILLQQQKRILYPLSLIHIYFWLMFEEEKLIAFVDGMVTNQEDLTDEMYEKAEMHDEKGDWQMIFGVNTLPSYRKHGYAGELIKRAITDAKKQGRKGLVLTCKDRLISYYARFGFKNEGVSESVHGNVVWNQMRLTFDEGLGE